MNWITRNIGKPRVQRADRTFLMVERLENREMLTVNLSVGTNINIARIAGDQVETTIAINPANPNNLYAVSNGFGGGAGRFSMNGGATWSTAGGLPGGYCCDAKAVFDTFGNLFVSYIGGSDELALSTNGGASFVDLITSGIGSDYPGVAVGPNGSGGQMVWAFGSSSGATMSARGALVTGLGAVGAFSAAQTATVGQFGDIAIGPTGQVTISGTHCTGSANGPCPIKVATDANGLGAGGFSAPVTVVTSNVGTFTPIPAEDNRTIHAHPNQSYNSNGRMFLTYTDRPSTGSADTDIYVQFSDNNGATWSPRIKINDDGATGKSQFYSDIDVDETTNFVACTWYDARNSPTNVAAQIYASASAMRGRDWAPNVQVATGLSNANSASSFEFGDYDTMDYYGGFFYRTWADNASPSTLTPPNTSAPGDQDMATARVTVTFTPAPDDWVYENNLDLTDFGRVASASQTDVTYTAPAPAVNTPAKQSAPVLGGNDAGTTRATLPGVTSKPVAVRAAASADAVQSLLVEGLTIEL